MVTAMSAALEKILAAVKSLKPEERDRLLRELQASNASQYFGKYASVATSSDQFCARKAEGMSRS